MKHKGIIEENHSHIETLGLVGDHGKTHYGENPFKLFFLLDWHWMIQERRVQWSISSSIQPRKNQLNNYAWDELNHANTQNSDWGAWNQLSLFVVNERKLQITGKQNPNIWSHIGRVVWVTEIIQLLPWARNPVTVVKISLWKARGCDSEALDASRI